MSAVIKRFFSFIAGGGVLVGAALSWRGIDLEGSDSSAPEVLGK
jgi:hypothetical protein